MTDAREGEQPPPVSPARARVVVAVALVLGAVLLATTIRADRDTTQFVAAGLSLAAVWIGAFLVARGRRAVRLTRPLLHAGIGLAVGLAMFGVFVGVAWAARRLDILTGPIDDILRRADERSRFWVIVLAVVNGVAEELFFRGTVMDAFTRRTAVLGSTAVYVVVTAAGGNLALALAAALMGLVFAIERRSTGTLVTPIATHLSWSLLMITAFPRS